jgi:hypothetical protein
MERKAINKEGRHVGLDFYDLLIEGHNTGEHEENYFDSWLMRSDFREQRPQQQS